MDSPIGGQIILQLLLIALNAVFACAEIAVISMDDARIEKLAQSGSAGGRRLRNLTSQPARFLATIQVAITLSGFMGSAFAADNFAELLTDWAMKNWPDLNAATVDNIAVVLITLILSYFTLVLGELVPKRVAQRNPEKIALGISGLISAISFSLYHVAMMIGWFSVAPFILVMVGLILGGIIFNFLNEKLDTIYCSWLTHMFANFAINTIGFMLLK